jgi:hypothetical protein
VGGCLLSACCWDCIAPLDDATVTMVEGLGGIDGIAISHPHFYIRRWCSVGGSTISLAISESRCFSVSPGRGRW